MANLIGQSLGRYHILEQLGEGGMAVVYKAFDTKLEREVALKVIRTEEILPSALERTKKRFEREAKALAKLNHANIVPIIDSGQEGDVPYLVMGYIPGGTLKEKIKGKPIPWRKAAELLLPIARALAYSHKQGIIHRDIKPSNILITAENELMLTDFGIARLLQADETLDLTGTGMGVGTPEYMAPEQGLGHKVDHRADIYALGIIFYEMLTGRKPFQADTPMAVVIKQINDPLPRPTQFAPDLPEEVERILLRALVKKPNNRYQSMVGFAKSLEDPLAKRALQKRPPISLKKRTRTFLAGSILVLTFILSSIWIGIKKPFSPVVAPPSLTATSSLTEPSVVIPPTSTITPTPTPTLIFETRLVDEMVALYIPAGEFKMGSEDGDEDEKPIKTVYTDAFWMDETEVTNAMFASFLNAQNNQKEDGETWLDVDDSSVLITQTESNWHADINYSQHPVVDVTWYGARAYCEWVGGRLPTEAEWEKAARGGLEGKKYPWGDDTPSCNSGAWNGAQKPSCSGNTISVGSFSPNGYGLYDMAGNVWEWIADQYDEEYYQKSSGNNPQGPAFGEFRVLRGGAWSGYEIDIVRTANRSRSRPMNAATNTGFRCVRDIAP
ncbi:MAG: SUMF1/EgtB/PvdO family nonheme iron enzyme [Anaerolineae bacterium]|jgi:serine/threonine protein kinase|nr:SUMF1/EgtB/PvdO family nonheme iron enzyme [Anaerolineae bacterium]